MVVVVLKQTVVIETIIALCLIHLLVVGNSLETGMKETGFENGFNNGEGIVGDDDSSEEEDEEVLDKPKEIIYNKCHLIRQFSPHYKLTSSSCC